MSVKRRKQLMTFLTPDSFAFSSKSGNLFTVLLNNDRHSFLYLQMRHDWCSCFAIEFPKMPLIPTFAIILHRKSFEMLIYHYLKYLMIYYAPKNHAPISKVKVTLVVSVFICMLSCLGCNPLMHRRILK